MSILLPRIPCTSYESVNDRIWYHCVFLCPQVMPMRLVKPSGVRFLLILCTRVTLQLLVMSSCMLCQRVSTQPRYVPHSSTNALVTISVICRHIYNNDHSCIIWTLSTHRSLIYSSMCKTEVLNTSSSIFNQAVQFQRFSCEWCTFTNIDFTVTLFRVHST